MQEPYVIAYQILHDMNNINRAWYTHKDQVYPLTYKLTKEQIEKDQERDQNMAKMITQLDILVKNIMSDGMRSVNVYIIGDVNLEEAKFSILQ